MILREVVGVSTTVLLLLLPNSKAVSPSRERWIDFTHFVPCIANVTSHYVGKTDFLFLSQELEYVEPTDEIIRHIRHSIVIQKIDQFAGRFGFFVLFPKERQSYESLFKVIQSSIYNKFLVVWPDKNTTDGLGTLINEFWSFRLMDVVILSQVSASTIHMYGYNPFMQSYCNKPSLELLNVWNIPESKLLGHNKLYSSSERRTFNLNGCPLICFAKNRPPDAIVRWVNNDWELAGVGGHLMRVIRKCFNFTSIIEVPKMNVSIDRYGYDISSGFPELVAARLTNHSVDLAFGIYSHIIYDNVDTEFPSVAVSECYCWAVPARMGRIIPTWMYYTQEFKLLVWICILLIYLAIVAIVYFYAKLHHPSPTVFHRPTFVTTYVFSLLLGISAMPRVVVPRLRIIVGLIALYSLIISSAYTSSMRSFLTVPWQRENIETFQEIVDANFLIEGTPQPSRILQRLSEGNPALQQLSRRFRTHKDHFDMLILRMQRKKDIATFAAQRFLQFYISEVLNNAGKEDIYLLPECIIQAHASPFLFKKGSPFINPVNRIILAAMEAGLTQYWFTYSTPKIAVSRFSSFHPLSLHQLMFAFVILLTGIFLSIVVFVVELHSNSDAAQIRRLQLQKVKRTIRLRRVKNRNNNLYCNNLVGEYWGSARPFK